MPKTDPLRRNHTLAAVVAGVVLAIAAIARAIGLQEFPSPFFWLDVALVYFLVALPLAASLATWSVVGVNPLRHGELLALEVVVLLFIPQLYVYARTQNDIARCIELAQQSRYGEASQLVHRTLQLAPWAKWNSNPLSNVAATFDQVIARIENSIAVPLAKDATDDQRIQRAEALAMLGRTNESLAVLNSSPVLANNAEACNLRGTIYETQRQWRSAGDWYGHSKTAWQPLPDSPARAAGLARALTGVAFCQRKLGRLREAEAAWQELLSLSPTADTHFLLAQFYEDTQQTEKSQFHVHQAMKLNPQQYVHPGQQLLSKLVTSHFGCVGILNSSSAGTR